MTTKVDCIPWQNALNMGFFVSLTLTQNDNNHFVSSLSHLLKEKDAPDEVHARAVHTTLISRLLATADPSGTQ